MRRLLLLVCLLTGLWGGRLFAQAAPTLTPPPAPVRWVTDEANLLSPSARNALELRLKAYQDATGHQVLVWIGGTTGTEPIEDWTVRAFAAWKVGRKGLDDGLVLFILTGDRKLRMEVGYGLEGQVPDLVASRIIRETIVPRLKTGDADGALSAGVDRILKVIGGDSAARSAQEPGSHAPIGIGGWIIIGLLGLAFLVLAISHPGLAVWLLFNLLSGGRGGGGGGDGGFSGGGGRSGGGGASGSW